ncbi:MAG TPA: ATP-binding protein [Verrucomicrobiae bacterium]|nr:ATP-binding protein [Verrucomicrobiae bacterium]
MAKEPKFFWRGVAILAPVLVLTALGLYSLKQDRLLAEAQARERAQELAEDFAKELMAVLQKEPPGDVLVFQVEATGKLVFPPPVSAVPIPAEPSEGAARYTAGLIAMQEGRAQDALKAFDAVDPDAVGATGLPLKPLAQLKWLELVARGVPAEPSNAQKQLREDPLAFIRSRVAAVEESLGSNAVYQPTLLTPQILQRLSNTKWREQWERHETIRAIYNSARQQIRSPLPQLLWADDWLLARQEAEPARYLCWHANVMDGTRGQGPFAFTASIGAPQNDWKLAEPAMRASPINRKLTDFLARLPRYFDYTLELAGKTISATNQLQERLRATGGKGTGRPWTTIGFSAAPPVYGAAARAQNGTEYLKIGIHLISPQMLYEREGDRAIIFGLLIAVSVVAAAVGCISAWRAFHRQYRLAELKSDFVSSVSHELRAPIASVRLMAEGLERGNVTDPQKQHDYFRFIVQECRRLGSMIENVLDFSRIEQGRKKYQFEPTDLPKLIEQTVKLMVPYAAERQVNLATDIARDVGEAQVDGRAIQQALVNLIDNAIKHSPAGAPVRVGLSTAVAERSGDTALVALSIQLSVHDQGPGIPPAEREKIFERFYRSGSELRRETQGVGIGLSIVKHIVDAHSGTIEVTSEPGKGSTFTIVLPSSKVLRDVPVEPSRKADTLVRPSSKDPNEP